MLGEKGTVHHAVRELHKTIGTRMAMEILLLVSTWVGNTFFHCNHGLERVTEGFLLYSHTLNFYIFTELAGRPKESGLLLSRLYFGR